MKLAIISGHRRTDAQTHREGARAPGSRWPAWSGRWPLLLLAACYESPVEPPVPPPARAAEIRWVEWPAELSTIVGESLRVVVATPCGTGRLHISTLNERVLITAEEVLTAAGECLDVHPPILDTLVPMPELNPAEPPQLFQPVRYPIVAAVPNPLTAVLEPALLGTMDLTFRPPFQPRRLAAGRVRMRVETGCAWATLDGKESESHLVLNPLPAIVEGEPPRTALVGVTFAANEPATCGRTRGVLLRFAQVDLFP